MALYIIGGIAAILLLLFIKALNKTNDLSADATVLVAYIKYAGKGKSSIFDKDKSDEEFYEMKYKDMMKACVLMNRFYLKVKDLPPTYRFHIKENGEMYGEIFEVQVGPLMYKLTESLTKITESFRLYRYCPWIVHTKQLAKYHCTTVQEERQVTYSSQFRSKAFHL